MVKLVCPEGHELLKDNKIRTKEGIYVQYKCACPVKYIYAPRVNRRKIFTKKREFETINLSHYVSQLNDGMNVETTSCNYKYYGEKIDIVLVKNSDTCITCKQNTKKFNFVVPKNDVPSIKIGGKICTKCNSIFYHPMSKKMMEDYANIIDKSDENIQYETEHIYESSLSNDTLMNPECPNEEKEDNILDFKITTYGHKIKRCVNCDRELSSVITKYLNSRGNVRYCTHKKCSYCDINYVAQNEASLISEGGKNSHIIFEKKIEISKKYSDSHASYGTPASSLIKQINVNLDNTKTEKKITNEKKSNFEQVIVHKSININCKNMHPEMVDRKKFMMINVKTNMIQNVIGFYCRKCHKNFVTIEAIKPYTDKYYVPQFKCVLSNDISSNLNQISLLALYGYTAKKDSISESQRHAIIDFVIDNGIMTPMDVIHLLEFNINFKGNIDSMKEAVHKWYGDIQYIYKKQ